MAKVWEGESERRTVVEWGGRWGGQRHICCSGCFMEIGGRRATGSLHIETLHFWGAKWNMWGSSTGRLEHIVCSAYT